jgi:hypothetical protein
MKDRDGPLAIFDDDLRARARSVSEVFAIGLKRTNKVGGADGIRIYQLGKAVHGGMCGRLKTPSSTSKPGQRRRWWQR